MATVQTGIADAIDAVADNPKLDSAAKMLLKHRAILAKILKECTEEFKDYDVAYIVEHCFVGEVKVSRVSVDQDTVDADATIVGTDTEDNSKNEGKITYDIVFDAAVPNTDDKVRMIINVEVQGDTGLPYAVVTRGVYYGSRLISRQKGTVFTHMDYQKIQKVYSVWICPKETGARANSIAEYGIVQKNTYGVVNEPVDNYDKMAVIIIRLNDKGVNDENEIISFLSTIFSTSESADVRKERLEGKYHIPMTQEMEEELRNMDKLSVAVWNEAQVAEKVSIALSMIQKGVGTLETIAEITGLPLEKVQELANASPKAV